MHQEPMDLLEKELKSLQDDVPPMPEDFHAGWMKQVEEEAMQKPSKKTTWTRILSVAAAAVFIIGGTILTRDDLSPKFSDATYESSYDYEYDYGSTSGYSMRSTSYDAAENTVMLAKASGADAPAAQEMGEEKKIIRNASLTITTQTFEESLAALRAKCESLGGWIAFSSENDSSYRRTANLTLRIPSDQLDAFLADAGNTGRVTRRSESADDVTESYYDTKARLATQQALMARLQALVTDAADLSDLLALESQIADTQYQIDRLQASLNSTDRQVDYATVDISLQEEKPADSITDPEKSLGERIADALSTGWESFVEFMADMTVFIAAALPFIVIVAVVVILVKVIRKKKK